MPPSPIPAPLPPWARTLIQLAPLIPAGLQEVLEFIGELRGPDDPNPEAWVQAVYQFEMVGNTVNADRWYTSFDVVNITNGSVDSTWTQADHDKVHTELNKIISAWAGTSSNKMKCSGCKHYLRHFTPLPTAPIPPGERDKPFEKTGPPVVTYPMNVLGIGTAVNVLPPQNAVSLTEKTAYPRHWGRAYLPALDISQYNVTGQLTAATVDALKTPLVEAYAALQAAEFFPVVPVVQIEGSPARGLLQVTSVQIDTNPDVIRRRRQRTTTYRSVGP